MYETCHDSSNVVHVQMFAYLMIDSAWNFILAFLKPGTCPQLAKGWLWTFT